MKVEVLVMATLPVFKIRRLPILTLSRRGAIMEIAACAVASTVSGTRTIAPAARAHPASKMRYRTGHFHVEVEESGCPCGPRDPHHTVRAVHPRGYTQPGDESKCSDGDINLVLHNEAGSASMPEKGIRRPLSTRERLSRL